MTQARILDVCDGIVTKIGDEWNPEGDDAITRVYVPPIKLEDIAGRRVYVFPADYGTVEPETRGEDLREYTISILVLERFTEQGPPTRDWLDERVNFVQEMIWLLLENPRDALLLGTLWPQSADVQPVYDPIMLSQKKLFWSEMEFVFREVQDA